MKTKITLLLTLTAFLFCNSCVGLKNLGVFDESVPEEQRVNLEVKNLTVVLYNDKPVSWSSGLTKNRISIELPPGKSKFLVKWTVVENQGTAIQRYVDHTKMVELDMQPGHSYMIYKQVIDLLFIQFTNIKTKEIKPKK